MKLKQTLSLVLFMIFTTTVVNAHALSHLFEDDISSIEVCETCDECVLSTFDDLLLPAQLEPHVSITIYQNLDSYVFNYQPVLVFTPVSGQYFNKPPPFKLA